MKRIWVSKPFPCDRKQIPNSIVRIQRSIDQDFPLWITVRELGHEISPVEFNLKREVNFFCSLTYNITWIIFFVLFYSVTYMDYIFRTFL